MLGRAAYALKAGETRTIKVRLARGTARLAKKRKLAARARVVSRGAAETTAKVTLRFR